jgi:hypothetical protein
MNLPAPSWLRQRRLGAEKQEEFSPLKEIRTSLKTKRKERRAAAEED